MGMKTTRKRYGADFKAKVVLEAIRRATALTPSRPESHSATIEALTSGA